ncbi:MAG: PD-(D/E)XK nuclease family protein, partial [Planctomycetes bacterium]|nr:PD-(D/E)XK nuclease family protein [Planctomycetota bacterium]
FTTVSYRSLPQLRRWWKLPSGRHLAGRDLESFSSLEKFIYSPYAWVLQHKAHLRAGPLSNLRLQPDSKLKGTLLHRLLDLVLAAPTAEIDWRTAIQPLLSSWLEGRWQTLLEQEGANLLLPGRIADGAALLESGKAALWELFQQMRAAGVTTAASNVALPATPFFGGNLGGIVDLVVESESARAGVIDLKLGGRETREKELADNRQLQLAVYGYLLARQRGGWPEGAFFILGSRRMLAQTNRYLLNARVVAPGTSSIGLQSCWSDFERVWHWRRRQLDAGWIEVTAEGADPEDRAPGVPEPVPPLPLWQATEEHAKYNAFDALTGWRTDA